jgi:WD40 repeat protein
MPTRPFAAAALLTATLAIAALTASAHPEAPAEPGEKEPVRNDRYGDPLPKGAVMRLGTLRFCQPLPACLAFSPDGKVLASGGEDDRIRFWDPDTGKEVRTLEGHKRPVTCIAFSADGKWLASGSQDRDLRVWDVATGKERRRFQGHDAPVERTALSPDGKLLASFCQAYTLRLWDTDTGKEVHSIPIDKGYRVYAMAFSPDGKYFAFGGRPEKGIQLVDTAEWKTIRAFEGHKDYVHDLTFSADGATLVSAGDDHTIRAWDVAGGKEQHRYGDETIAARRLAFAADGKTLAYCTWPDGMVHIWDIAAKKDLVPPWKPSPPNVDSVAFSPDASKVAVARDTIAVYETTTGKRRNPLREGEGRIQQVEFAPDGKLLAVCREDEPIEVWETAKWRKSAAIKAQAGRFTSMAFAPGGKGLATAEGPQGVLRHWDPETGKALRDFSTRVALVESLSYSADGDTLACIRTLTGGDSQFVPLDAATGKVWSRIVELGHVRSGKLSPDGRFLVCMSERSEVVLLDRYRQKEVRRFGERLPAPVAGEFGERLPAPVAGDPLALSPDGRTIATPGGQGVDGNAPGWTDIVLWETATGQERLRIAMNEGPLALLAFSPDGRLLASAGRTETIRLWDAWTGKEIGSFTGHRGWLRSLSFAPDGKTLASGGADTTVLIWDVTGLPPVEKKPAEELSGDQLAKYWDDLAGEDATRAYQAVAELARRPELAEGLFKDKFAVNPAMNAERLNRLIADLDADDRAVRDRASKELADLGQLAEGALRQALTRSPSVELKLRAMSLLDKMQRKDCPERSRLLRAIEVLERLGTPNARRLLGRLEKEATVADVAREATASLARLEKAVGGAP